MAGVHGEALYGRIDRVPGLFFVATQFFHINFVPLVPLGTYLIADGSISDKGFNGKRIGWSGKSVLVGYYRGWVGTAAAVLFAIGLGTAGDALAGDWALIALAAAGFGLSILAVQQTGAVWWVSFLLVMLTGAGLLAALEMNPPVVVPGRPKKGENATDFILAAMACLGSVTLMRVFDRAGRTRAHELAAEFGIPPEVVDVALGGSAAPLDDPDAAERAADTGA